MQPIRLHQPRLGTRKLHHVLRTRLAYPIAGDRLFAILRTAHLLVPPQRAYHKTTQSHHRFWRHPNLLKEAPHQVEPTGPKQVWVADITYLPTRSKCAYLSLITDAWSHKIVGYHVTASLQAEEVSRALNIAVRSRHTRTALIHHSDRGIQYCSSPLSSPSSSSWPGVLHDGRL